MPGDISISIDTHEVDELLAKLPARVSRKIRGEALQKAGDIILAVMVDLAPEMKEEQDPSSNALPPGVLKADLHTNVVTNRQGGAYIDIGPGDVSGHVCRLQEDGYNLTTHGKRASRKIIKAIPGKHFMASAADQTFNAAVDAFVDSVTQAVEGSDDTGSGDDE